MNTKTFIVFLTIGWITFSSTQASAAVVTDPVVPEEAPASTNLVPEEGAEELTTETVMVDKELLPINIRNMSNETVAIIYPATGVVVYDVASGTTPDDVVILMASMIKKRDMEYTKAANMLTMQLRQLATQSRIQQQVIQQAKSITGVMFNTLNGKMLQAPKPKAPVVEKEPVVEEEPEAKE